MSPHPAPIPRPLPTAVATRALLRLSASRGKLALELAEPFPVGPLRITHLISCLDGLQFPVDLSGGVARFRHRRGTLEALTVEARLSHLTEFLAPKARSALDSPRLRLALLPTDSGLTVGVEDDHKALAFTAYFAPEDEQVRFVIASARAVGFGCHAHAAALRLARTLCGPNATRHGSVVTIDRSLSRLVREALLDAGARLPSCLGVQLAWETTEDGVRMDASATSNGIVPTPQVLRAIELARIAQRGDDALASDSLDDARAAYMAALEAAPRHPDLALRIAELDLLAGHTPESTLASVVETMPAVDGGVIAAQLLAALGDKQAAAVALQRAAESEPYAPLAARMVATAASHGSELADRLTLLDDALVLCPSCSSIRWQRARARLTHGRFTDAVADLGHLEAAARGAHARFDVCLQAGHLLMKARLHLDARTFFEKALRYCPRSPQASAGLARAFFAIGDGRRGVALLSRAATLMQSSDSPDPSVVIELATALAEHTKDLSAAIYHVRAIPFGLKETIAARALEARWRSQLDDTVGACHAFFQAREAAAHLPLSAVADSVHWLLEAARFELDVHGDPRAAKRHAELALHATPNDARVEQLFRRAARAELTLLDRASHHDDVSETALEVSSGQGCNDAVKEPAFAQPPSQDPPLPAETIPPPDPFDLIEQDVDDSKLEDESQIESLTDRVRANPDDQQAVRRLCSVLERAGRHLDLLALASARLEETTDASLRADLLAIRERVLNALIEECRAEGRVDEAEMYEMVLASAKDSES